MSQENLFLYDSNGMDYTFENSKDSLPAAKYTHYKIVYGMWILYRNENFNACQPCGTQNDIVLDVEATGIKKKLPDNFSPKSVRRLRNGSDSVELFEHNYYGGTSKELFEASEDVTKWFPPNQPSGVSSIIIWPNKSWELHGTKNFGVGKATKPPGKYPCFNGTGFADDRLQSLRPA